MSAYRSLVLCLSVAVTACALFGCPVGVVVGRTPVVLRLSSVDGGGPLANQAIVVAAVFEPLDGIVDLRDLDFSDDAVTSLHEGSTNENGEFTVLLGSFLSSSDYLIPGALTPAEQCSRSDIVSQIMIVRWNRDGETVTLVLDAGDAYVDGGDSSVDAFLGKSSTDGEYSIEVLDVLCPIAPAGEPEIDALRPTYF